MKSKGILSVLLVLLMLFGMAANVMATDIPAFSDMPGNWSKAAIEKAVSNGLLTGANGKIMPDEKLTRAQLAAVLNRTFGSIEKASLESFSDVKISSWYYDDMAKAVNMGAFKGSGGKLFPENAITREEVFTALARAFKLPSADTAALNKFSDSASVASWAKASVAALTAAGYVHGTDGKLNPKANITRAEFAQIMDNMIKGYITSAGTYTSVTGGNIMINAANVTLKGVTVSGDLIIGDGVGDGDVTLDSVKVSGRILVRGGGVNSIKIIGASEAGSVVVVRIDGKVRVVVAGDANVQVIEIDDGSDDVIVEGTVGSIDIRAAGINVTANNARIGTVTVAGEGSGIVVGAGTTVDKIKLDAKKTGAEVAGTVKSIEATKNAENAAVTGTGHVTGVQANANNVRVETPNTTVTAGPGTSGITNGGKPVEPGNTVTGQSGTGTTTGTKTGGTTDDDDPGTPSVISITNLNVTADSNSDLVKVTATVTNAGASNTAVIAFTGTEGKKGSPALAGASLASKADVEKEDYYTTTYSDVPVVNGKINYTIYGELDNDSYTVMVTVGTATATKSDFVLDAGISLYSYSESSEYSLSKFGTGNSGIDLCFYDNESLDAGQYASYSYDVTAFNLTGGTSLNLLSSGTFSEDDFTDLQNHDFYLSCNSPDFFTLGSYAIVAKISLNGSLAGEASVTFSILPEAPVVSIDYANESISGYDGNTMEYHWEKYSGTATWLSDIDFSAAYSLTDNIPSAYPIWLYVHVKSPKSLSSCITIPVRLSAPTGLSASAATSASSSDGKITGLVSTNTYQYKLYTNTIWTDADANATEVSGLSAGTYYVRIKATSGSFSSKAVTVSVLDSTATPLEAPVLESASVTEAAPAKLMLKFSKDMSGTGIEASDFVVKGKSRNPDYGSLENKTISSAMLNSSDPSIVELTLNYDMRADFRYYAAYNSGTAVSSDGAALASFSNQAVDNQMIYNDLVITLSADVNYIDYRELSVSDISLGDGDYFNESYTYGYKVCSDSGTAGPAPGTEIDEIPDVTTGSSAIYHMARENAYSAGDYLLMYAYDKYDNNVIYGFGQVQIAGENLGKGWSQLDLSDKTNGIFTRSAQRGQPQKTFSATLSADQEVTAIGGDDAVWVSVDATNPLNPIYTMDTSLISTTGGCLSFILTIADSTLNASYEKSLRVEIEPVTPAVELDSSGYLYVTGATPGLEIVVFHAASASDVGGSSIDSSSTIIVGTDGTVTINPADFNSGYGLTVGNYYCVEQKIDGVFSSPSNIIQYIP